MESSIDTFDFLLANSTDKAEDQKIMQPYLHIAVGLSSKKMQHLMKILNHWLKIPDDILVDLVYILSVLINSCLLLDDMQDNSSLRRARPTAHLVYGIQRTVAASYFAMTLAMNKLVEHGRQDAVRALTDPCLDVHWGQTIEIYWRDNFVCPREQDYIEMVKLKSGSMIRFMMEIMKCYSENKTDYSTVSTMMGVYLQIHDDYGNLRFQKYTKRKGFCEDLTEGKFSFPIIHAIHSHPEDKRVYNIVKQRTTDDEVKKTCVKILEEYGSFEYTERVLEDMCGKIRAEIKRLDGNPFFEEALDQTKIVDAMSKLAVCA